MNRFSVKVRTEEGTVAYSAIGWSSFDVLLAAIELFGVCGVTVKATA